MHKTQGLIEQEVFSATERGIKSFEIRTYFPNVAVIKCLDYFIVEAYLFRWLC
ncbi:hypothetical protein CIPAW_15G185800 [Carya illinoinensis]|uniref:Uncharacterized protein n=1 Tax=Carya illinoinensis TaxID=32201 RepID=A0A8T1N925_CARIL|nr:hypothetical protein CIPAW_15G185800 [Carya illinoinensis]